MSCHENSFKHNKQTSSSEVRTKTVSFRNQTSILAALINDGRPSFLLWLRPRLLSLSLEKEIEGAAGAILRWISFDLWNSLDMTQWTYTKHGPGSMDHPMVPVHGPPWTTPWTWSMDQVHGPPLIFKRKSPLLRWKFTGGQGMKNTDSYFFINIPWLQICSLWVNFVYKINRLIFMHDRV